MEEGAPVGFLVGMEGAVVGFLVGMEGATVGFLVGMEGATVGLLVGATIESISHTKFGIEYEQGRSFHSVYLLLLSRIP
jgi:hypothetical protein